MEEAPVIPKKAMTRGFRNMLIDSDVEELNSAILLSIPQQSEQILGRQNLKPIDLLDLPMVSKNFPHRLTSLDIAVDVGLPKICIMRTILHPTTAVNVLEPGI